MRSWTMPGSRQKVARGDQFGSLLRFTDPTAQWPYFLTELLLRIPWRLVVDWPTKSCLSSDSTLPTARHVHDGCRDA
ncbi:MAG: hypothetical protein ACLGIY_21620 [Betaproteobacteria bacterium]|jgi:hypothetical protein|uniref:hypothetical protein n=1 Tax=Acidovorax sp. 210-6 TaxID=2699468 RepID=UPI00138A07C0|nr:hypothetical protein [Acidovorax sp. 210-6]NCU66837.1 hypothetical protein [Acidovorax sp. 210-6]